MKEIALDESTAGRAASDITAVSHLYFAAHRRDKNFPALSIQECFINYSKCYFLPVNSGEYTVLLHFECEFSRSDKLRGDIYYDVRGKREYCYTILKRGRTGYILSGNVNEENKAVINEQRTCKIPLLKRITGK